MTIRARRLVLPVLLVVVLVAVAAFWFMRPERISVTVHTVARGTVEEIAVNSKAGRAEARKRSQLSTAVGGRVARIHVREGDTVVAGQVLLSLDDAEVRSQVLQAERGVAVAREELRRSRIEEAQRASDLRRAESMLRQGVISRERFEHATEAFDLAVARSAGLVERVAEAQAGANAARANLPHMVINAPFTGVVGEITTEVGEYVSPSPPGVRIPPVIEVIGIGGERGGDNLYVVAPMDEIDVARIQTGMAARVTLDAFPGRSFSGRVTRTSPFVLDVEEQNRTFDVEIELDSPPSGLLPGVTADVEIILGSGENVLRAPTYAIADRKRVYRVEEDRVRAVEVEVGIGNWDFTEIVSGLSEGDRIVTNIDRAELEDGVRVEVSDSSEN